MATYTEYGTGTQYTDASKLNPNTKYVESGTGKTALGSAFYSTPTTQKTTTPTATVAPAQQPQAAPQPSQTIAETTATTATTPTQAIQQPKADGGTEQKQPTESLTFNGSIVDLLDQAGVDSSYAARAQLAQQFGIKNYTGTTQQNIDLGKKYVDAFNAQNGKEVPNSGGDARAALRDYFSSPQLNDAALDPQRDFFDQVAGLNPVQNQIFSMMGQVFSSINTQQSFVDLYGQLQKEQGLPALNMELANIQNIMDGTEDDIRNEITAVGGFATESQVQALTAARNKTLLKQANNLANIIAVKNDYVNNIVQLTKADRDQVSKALDQNWGFWTR